MQPSTASPGLCSPVQSGGSDLESLVIALYVSVDDLLRARHQQPGPGVKPRLSDSELVCLAVAQVMLRFNSERRWLRHVQQRWGHLFPYLPNQPGYNKRLRARAGLLTWVLQQLAAATPSWCDSLRLLDSTPVPCAASRETVKRSDLAGWANYGYCAAHTRFYWGLRLYLLTTADGIPVNWCLADPKLGEREVAQAMLEQAPPAPGTLIVADKGFAGREFESFVYELQAVLARPDRRDEAPRWGPLGWIRQRIESVNWTLKGQLGLEEHGARTPLGVFARVAQRLLALTAGIWHNWLIGAPDKRSLVAYDH